MSGAFRILLRLLFYLSLAWTVLICLQLRADPAIRLLVDASAARIEAAADRAMAKAATQSRVVALIASRLADDPRNWVALDALADVAAERGYPLPSDFMTLRDGDFGWIAQGTSCAACAWDIGLCSLSNVMVCKLPILMTPVEDLRGVVKAGADWTLGADVDQVDLGLSVVGLTATVLVLASGGSSMTVKTGAALVKAARGLRLVSPRLIAFVAHTATRAVDLSALRRVRSADDLIAAVRISDIAPLARMAQDLGRLQGAVGTPAALHLLPLADDGAEVARLADVATVLKAKTVGRAEVLGKTRLLRLTLRLGKTAWHLVGGVAGVVLTLGAALLGWVQTRSLRMARRWMGPPRKRRCRLIGSPVI